MPCAGQQIALVNANGNATTYQYDPAGRKTVEIDALARATTFGYDAASQKTVRTDGSRHHDDLLPTIRPAGSSIGSTPPIRPSRSATTPTTTG